MNEHNALETKHQHFKTRIGISGAAETGHCGEEAYNIAVELGHQIAEQGAILITGATTGFPLWVSRGVKEKGGTVIGISPAGSEEEHVELYKLPLEFTDLILYTGAGYTGRDIILTKTADGVLLGCGRIGTLHEFTVAFEMQKPIGIVEGPWKMADVIRAVIDNAHRPNEKIFFERDPKTVVSKLIEMIKKEKKEGYGVYSGGSDFYRECEGPTCKVIL
jgi:uncharacterized protein (TIGR00725 family)